MSSPLICGLSHGSVTTLLCLSILGCLPEAADSKDTACEDAAEWYPDADGDGFGDPAASLVACQAPDGHVPDNTDCDDSDATVNPDRSEICNGGIDDDCDDLADDDDTPADPTAWYPDLDGDGFGSSSESPLTSCEMPKGHASNDGDCDDSESAVNPDQREFCNGIDDDCDNTADEPDADGTTTWYLDSDGDGFGSPDTSQAACDAPKGYASCSTDCDDTNASVNPDHAESCNGIDDDCDEAVDEPDAEDAVTWHEDADEDGYGNPDVSQIACGAPKGWHADASDCDDTRAEVNPAALELCSTNSDDNCDGSFNEGTATDAVTWYRDADGDAFGDADLSVAACEAPSGFILDNADCDDINSAVNPDRIELCNGIDDDCDSLVDEPDAQGAATWYQDADSDGYGDDTTYEVACYTPPGYIADAGDCDDAHAEVNPAASERCSTVQDDNCDGTANESTAIDTQTWFEDADRDTFGNPGVMTQACTAPRAWVGESGDCDDADQWINPQILETPNDGIDQNCDGSDACTDLNCDGWPDLVVSNMHDGYTYNLDSAVYWGSATGFDTSSPTLLPTNGAMDNTLADLDLDGWPDIVFSNFIDGNNGSPGNPDTDSFIYWGSAGGFTTANRTGLPTHAVHGNTVAHLNADIWPDIVFANAIGESMIYWGSASGFSSSSVTSLSVTGAHDVEAADFNQDGQTDLVFAVEPTNSLILWGSTTGFFTVAPSVLASFKANGTAIADLDLDGWTDIVIANTYSGANGNIDSTVFWSNQGAFSLADTTSLPTMYATGVSISDVDVDGWPDILFANFHNTATTDWSIDSYVYFGSAGGFTPKHRDFLAGRGASAIMADDLDLDGIPDVVLSNTYESSYNIDSYLYMSDGLRFDIPTHGAQRISSTVWAPPMNGQVPQLSGSIDLLTDAEIYASTASSNFGWSVAIADDLNADGIDDVVVGAPQLATNGSVSIFFGNSNGTVLDAPDVTLVGVGSSDRLGLAIDFGDMTGDGATDLLVAGFDEGSTSDSGAQVFLLAGPLDASTTLADAVISIDGGSSDRYGDVSVAFAGDVDRDMIGDFMVGYEHYAFNGHSADTGHSYLFLGGQSGPLIPADAELHVYGEAADVRGSQVGSAGEVDGDGFSDLLFGSRNYGSGDGRAYLIYGPASGSMSLASADAIFTAAQTGGQLGRRVTGAGDVNADGYDDILLAATEGTPQPGWTYLYHGSASGPVGGSVANADAILSGQTPGNQNAGTGLSRCGDIDNDGFDDIMVGAPIYSSGNGRAYLLHGPITSQDLSTADAIFDAPSDRLGFSVSAGGDVTGDGLSDYIMGALGANTVYLLTSDRLF